MGAQDKSVAEALPAARGGCSEALGQVLESCRGYLLQIAGQELDPALQAKGGASDLVQDTFLKAQHHFGQFQGETEAELKAWLRQILLNNVADFSRHYQQTDKRQVGREVPLASPESSGATGPEPAAPSPSPSGEAIQREQAQAIQQALERLPEEYRRVLQYRYQEQRAFEDIGQLMNLTPNAARKLWVRAVKRLQQESGLAP